MIADENKNLLHCADGIVVVYKNTKKDKELSLTLIIYANRTRILPLRGWPCPCFCRVVMLRNLYVAKEGDGVDCLYYPVTRSSHQVILS